MTTPDIQLKTAQALQEYSDAADLIIAYVTWLGFDLSFQNFDKEMADLPEMYNPTNGGLYVVYLDEKPVAVAGLRRFGENDGEVKRMYVKPEARGHGIGKLLLTKCIEDAKALHYDTLKLDTADYMTAAIKLYTDHGFTEIPAYRFNPHAEAKYFELPLK
ncbi:GNAT family N-acetyltransferase [Dyadobacter luticola]|uniref:GNAT family N-acetyltransferase n=1 Tax=Dyadobacter luticola TaxID=1979387 RepID=A0A5R9L3R3_9BACT|nr:GNAT family N-acetyltransferase [Dyadobacter luticola]TLV02925.1 GNAT family N-acetyltransferase [Dyadobacter luticola]